MKKLIALFAAIVLVSGMTTVKAQVSATASGSATIIAPISIVNAGNLVFGNIAVSTTAGTVALSATGARTAGGGVTLPATAGTYNAAAFTVSGKALSTYSITLPSTDLVLKNGVNNTMTVNAFTCDITGAGTIAAGGSQTIHVGATLNVGGAQAAGDYLSATPFTVTVNYN